MYRPILGTIETQNKHLRNHEYIGGWEDGNDVYLWYRKPEEYEKRQVVKISNVPKYFILSKSDFLKIQKIDLADYKKRKFFKDGKLYGNYAYFYQTDKIYKDTFNGWLEETEIKHNIKWLEADITRLQRIMIDLNLSVAKPETENGPRIAFFDIETDDRGGKPKPGEDRILSIVWKDYQTGNEYFLSCRNNSDEAEKDFLVQVMEKLCQYDILVGYNNYNFDDVCLLGRFRYYGMDTTKWRRIATLDMYNLMERQGTFRQYGANNKKLDTIAKILLGRGKVEHTEKVYELWQNNPQLLEIYNYEDVRLIYEMEKKLGTIRLVLSVSATAGLLHSLRYSPAKTVDTFILRKTAQNRRAEINDFRYPTQYYLKCHQLNSLGSGYSRNALPSDKRKDRKGQLEDMGIDYNPVEGAVVLDVEPGIYRNVYFCDFNSLYPNAIRAFNIGLDTLIPDGEIEKYSNKIKSPNPNVDNIYFRNDIKSNMVECIEVLLDERAKIRAEMKKETDPVILQAMDIQQRGVKELTNSFYGVTAQWGGRYYNRQVAESITGSGRLFLPFGKQYIENVIGLGCRIALGDTDSLAISIPDVLELSAEEIKDMYLEELRTVLVENYGVIRTDVLNMSVERKASAVLITAKKLYALLQVVKDGKPCDPTLIIKGLGITKGNAPKWAATFCKKILVDILSGEKDADYFIRRLKEERTRLENNEILISELLISARLGKELNEYVGKYPLVHVRVARRLQDNGKMINSYSTITYLVTDGNDEHIEAVDESEIIPNETQYDAAYLWNVFIMQQAGNYLSIVFPEVEWDEFRFPKNYKRHPFELKLLVKEK